MEELAPPSRKNTRPVVILWRGSHHAYHDCLRAAIAELAASGGLSRHWLGAPGGPVFFFFTEVIYEMSVSATADRLLERITRSQRLLSRRTMTSRVSPVGARTLTSVARPSTVWSVAPHQEITKSKVNHKMPVPAMAARRSERITRSPRLLSRRMMKGRVL